MYRTYHVYYKCMFAVCVCVCVIVNAFATMCSYKSVFHHAGFVPGNVLR